MVSYTVSDITKHVSLYADKLGLDFRGMKIRECIGIIQASCPRLHSDDEIREYASRNLKRIKDKYSYKGLRIFYYSYIKDDLLKSFTGNDALEDKYNKLIKDIKKYHMNECLEWITLQLDYYQYQKILEDVYHEEYGKLNDWNHNLYSIMKTIHLSNYNSTVIDVLFPYLERYLIISGDKYYQNQNLKDPEILEALYEHITEESFDEIQYLTDNIFAGFDGYGNEYYFHEYSESWTDDDGVHHYRSWEKPSTINDFIKKGG